MSAEILLEFQQRSRTSGIRRPWKRRRPSIVAQGRHHSRLPLSGLSSRAALVAARHQRARRLPRNVARATPGTARPYRDARNQMRREPFCDRAFAAGRRAVDSNDGIWVRHALLIGGRATDLASGRIFTQYSVTHRKNFDGVIGAQCLGASPLSLSTPCTICAAASGHSDAMKLPVCCFRQRFLKLRPPCARRACRPSVRPRNSPVLMPHEPPWPEQRSSTVISSGLRQKLEHFRSFRAHILRARMACEMQRHRSRRGLHAGREPVPLGDIDDVFRKIKRRL